MASNFVLGSGKSSTGTRPPHHSAARTDLVLLIRRTVRPKGYALGPSLAAALPAERRVSARRGRAGEKSGLFEHPAGVFSCCVICADHRISRVPIWIFLSLLDFSMPLRQQRSALLGRRLSAAEP